MSSIRVRLQRFFRLTGYLLIQFVQRNVIGFKRSWLLSPKTQPDKLIRLFSGRSDLYPAREFLPRSTEDGKHSMPLVIMVHGGGFVMNQPCVDDPLARHLADNCNSVVTSVDYRKAPSHQFPAAYEDVVESILALLGMNNKHGLDASRVILCGSSAGGNLVLAAAQDPRLRGKLLGIAAIYPVVKMLPSEAEMMANRPDPTIPDFLEGMWDTVLDLYVGSHEPSALKDPRLSPANYKRREHLPKHILMIGCEHDMLCHESMLMAESLANSMPEKTEDGWQTDTVQWKLAKGQTHGFDHFPKKIPEEEEARKRAKDMLYADIAKWLEARFTT